MSAARQKFESKLVTQFAKTNSSKIYKYISNVTGSCSIPNIMFLDYQTFENNESISNGFNQYFYSVFTCQSNPPPINKSNSNSIVTSISITPEDVFQYLSTLDITKANGIDGMVLRYCVGLVSSLIYFMYRIVLFLQRMAYRYKSGSTNIRNIPALFTL